MGSKLLLKAGDGGGAGGTVFPNTAQFAQVARYSTYQHGQPNALPINAGDTNYQCTSTFKTLCDISGTIKFFFTNRNGATGDTASANSVSKRAGFNPGTGTFQPVLFSGVRDVTITSLGGLYCDDIAIVGTIPAGTYIQITELITVTAGQSVYSNGLFQHSNGGAVGVDSAAGDPSAVTRIESGVGLTDKTLVGGVSLGNAFYYDSRPDRVVAKKSPKIPYLHIMGDSIPDGFPDNVNLGYVGYMQRACEALGYCFYKLSKGAETAVSYANPANFPYRKSILPEASHCSMHYGINDLIAGSLLAPLQANYITIWRANQTAWQAVNLVGKIWQYQDTIFPNTGTSDNWTTGLNQTVKSFESVRLAANAWMRDGCPYNSATFAPVPTGTSPANTIRCNVYSAAGILTFAGDPSHALTGGIFDTAPLVTMLGGLSGTDEVWAFDGITAFKWTPDGLHPSGLTGATLNAHRDLLAAGINLAALLNPNFGGLSMLAPVQWATNATLPGLSGYSNGTAGVGATIGGLGPFAVDGNAPVLGDRILVKNQVAALQNGIYTVTALTGGVSYTLTRATDCDQSAEFAGTAVNVLGGIANAGLNFAYYGPLAPVIGTDSLGYHTYN